MKTIVLSTARRVALAAALWLALLSSLWAGPFAGKIFFTQPDGTVLELWGQGDEFHAVFETLDGYTVLFEPAVKAYSYARLSPDGMQLVSTGVRVGAGDPAALQLPRHLRLKPEAVKQQAAARRVQWDDAMGVSTRWAKLKQSLHASTKAPPSRTTTGTKIGLCLLIDFDNDPATIPQAEIDQFCNGDNYSGNGNNGSVKKYFQDVSNGRLLYSNVITLYVRIPNSLHPKSYYNDTSKNAGEQANLLIRDALEVLKALPNYTTDILPAFNALTADAANQVVAMNVFYAGDNGGAWAMGLWPHAWGLYTVGAQELFPGGKTVFRYQVSNIGSKLTLGTFCHENGHMLCGFPDLYDYDYDSVGGAGDFCLMGYGGSGVNPVQVCAYLKAAAGWATLTDLTIGSSLAGSLSSSGAGFNSFYRYVRPDVATEYFLIENRQRAGRDASLPASGIAIWHVDELGDRDNQSLATNSSHLNFEVTLEQADNRWDFQHYDNSGDAKDLFYRGNSAPDYGNKFSDSTSPGASWWDGLPSGLNLKSFSVSGQVMTFNINQDSPVIVRDPISQRAEEGTSVTFDVEVEGSAPLFYRWYFNGMAMPGATASALVLPEVGFAHAGRYSVVVSNAYGADTSAEAVLTVTRAVPLGNAVDAPALLWTTGGNAKWRGRPSPAHDGDDAAQSGALTNSQVSWMETAVVGPGTLSFWWKVSSELTFDLLQFSMNGALKAQMSGERDWTNVTFAVPAGLQTLRWQFVKDSSMSAGNDAAWVDQISFVADSLQAPIIIVQPVSRSVLGGSNVAFTVAVAGASPFSYQWFVNGSPLAGATAATLALTHVQTAQSGLYSVTVSNAVGGVVSTEAELRVIMPGSGFVDHFDPDIDRPQWLEFGGTVQATNHGGSVSGPNALWFGGDGTRFATTRPIDTASGGVLRFQIRLSDGNHLFWEAPDPEDGVVLEYTTDGGVSWTLMASFAPGSFSAWTSQELAFPPGALGAGVVFRWRQLSNSGYCCDNWALDDVEVAPLPSRPVITSQPLDTNAPTGGSATFTVTAAGSQPLDYQWWFNNALLPGATGATLVLTNAQAGHVGDYFVVVTNLYGSATSQIAELSVGDNFPPVILSQPGSQIAPLGANVLFTVAAQGQAPLWFQWFRNGAPLAGATNDTLSLTAVRASQMGRYSVLVSNALGSAVSSEANLLVLVPGSGFFDDFDPDTDAPQWSGFGGIALATNFGGTVSAPNALWFDGDGSRHATTRSLNTLAGGFIQFQLRLANDSLAPWEAVDQGEGVVLEFTTDSGANWAALAQYDPEACAEWTFVELAIPSDAQATNTLFRWRQLANSGAGFDQWALDNVAIAAKGGTAPTITLPGGLVVLTNIVNQPVPVIDFTVGDAETPAANLVVSASSSNPALVSDGNLVPGGSGASRTLTIYPAAGVTGSATISLQVVDEDGISATAAFELMVVPVPQRTVKFFIGSASGPSGMFVSIPVQVEAFTNISGFQFSFHWDATVATFAGVSSLGVPPDLGEINVGTNFASNGTLTFSWDDPLGGASSVTDGARLFSVDFVLSSPVPASCAVSIDGNPTILEILDEDLNPIKAEVHDGTLTVTASGDIVLRGMVSYFHPEDPFPGVTVTLSGDDAQQVVTPDDGKFRFVVEPGGDYEIAPWRAADMPAVDGVTMTDISLTRRHILGVSNLTSSQLVAADANGSSGVSTADIILLRRLILGLTNSLPAGEWKFIPTNLVFENQKTTVTNADFLGLKVGDVNGSWWNLPGKFIEASNCVDMIHDAARDVLYLSTSHGEVLRYHIGSNVFLSPFTLGGELVGIDLSPDGNILVVADGTRSASNVWIHVIDLVAGTNHTVNFPRASGESGTFAVAFGADGAALVSSAFGGSGSVPLRRYDPATDSATEIATISQDSMVSASADGSTIGVAEGNNSSGPVQRYDVATKTLSSATNTDWFNFEIGVNRNGSQFALPTYGGTFIYDSNFNLLATLGDYAAELPIGVAYHPTEDIVFFAWADTREVRAFNSTTFAELARFNFAHDFTWPGNHAFDQGRLRLSHDGTILFATVEGGIRWLLHGLSLSSPAPALAGSAKKQAASPAPSESRVAFQAARFEALPGGTIKVPVTVAGFTNVTSFQGSLRWDTNVLRFLGVEDFALPGLDTVNFNTLIAARGQLAFAWDDPVGGRLARADGTVVFALRFAVVGGLGTVSPVAFTDAPTLREVAVNILPVEFASLSGRVTVSAQAVRFTSVPLRLENGQLQFNAIAPAGQRVTIQVSTDLHQWNDLSTWTNLTGVFQFTAPQTPSGPRFYRLRVAP